MRTGVITIRGSSITKERRKGQSVAGVLRRIGERFERLHRNFEYVTVELEYTTLEGKPILRVILNHRSVSRE